MTSHKTRWFLAGLVFLALWPAQASAQQGAWERHMGAAVAAYQQSNYAEAVAQSKAALKAREAFGSEYPRLANTFSNLSLFYNAQGKYARAEPLYRRALAIVEKVLGPEHPNVASDLNNLARIIYETA